MKGIKYIVHPCVERENRNVERPSDNEEAQFYGVYIKNKHGEEYNIADFIHGEDALFFVMMIQQSETLQDKYKNYKG